MIIREKYLNAVKLCISEIEKQLLDNNSNNRTVCQKISEEKNRMLQELSNYSNSCEIELNMTEREYVVFSPTIWDIHIEAID